jgi:ectoine hydroxylase-related dioxygenase (phytanoyl-CoA dioxygenase family)
VLCSVYNGMFAVHVHIITLSMAVHTLNATHSTFPIEPYRYHQDAYYIHEDPPEFVTILVSLDKTAPGAGATKFVTGSHHNGLLNTPSSESADPARAARGLDPRAGGTIPPDVAELQGPSVVEPELAPGDALVISPFVVHSVGDNHTDSTKCSVAFVYKAAGSIDREPGGNWRAFAELPVVRGGRPSVSFHF